MRNPLLCVVALALTVPALAAPPVVCGFDEPKVSVPSAAAKDDGVSLLMTLEDSSGAVRKVVLPAIVGAAHTVTFADYPGFAVTLRATSGQSSATLMVAIETWCRGVPIEERAREVPLRDRSNLALNPRRARATLVRAGWLGVRRHKRRD